MRYKGPVKGMLVLVNEDKEETFLFPIEPVRVEEDVYNAIIAGNTNVMLKVEKDPATKTVYAYAIWEEGGPQ